MAGNDVYKLIYLLVNDVYMAKLYWRVKRNGKWTWVAFEKSNSTVDFESPSGWRYVEEETE